MPGETLLKAAQRHGKRIPHLCAKEGLRPDGNCRALISLALMSGQIGRPGTGLHPLRGRNNVHGASDVGLIPMVFPDYQRVDNAQVRGKFEALWKHPLDPNPGLTVVEIMHAITDADASNRIRAM